MSGKDNELRERTREESRREDSAAAPTEELKTKN
jgi:hypothetical protein